MIWEQLGFRKSPYFWDELSVSEEASDLFVGRKQENNRFVINLAESNGSTLIVGGRSGIGKTSFINYNQYALYQRLDNAYPEIKFKKPRLLPSLRKIQLRDAEPVESICVKILSGILFSVQQICAEQKKKLPKELEDIGRYVTQLVSHNVTGGGGFSILGTGGNFTGSKSSAISDTVQFRELTFLEYLDRIAEVVNTKLGFDGVLVSINNLDIVSSDYIKGTLDYFRDSLFSKHLYWWVLIGPIGLHSFVRQNIPRLSGVITGNPIELEPLSTDEIDQLLGKRLSYLSIRRNTPSAPISSRIVRYLYERSDGDIRFVFQVANDIVKRVFYDYPSVTAIEEELAMHEVVKLTVDELSISNFTPEERSIILTIIQESTPLITYDQQIMFGIESKEIFSLTLESLVRRKLLTRNSKVERNVTYSPRGYVALAQTFGVRDFPGVMEKALKL